MRTGLAKVCAGCGETKPTTDFGPAPSNVDGLRTRCRPCYNAAEVERRHPESAPPVGLDGWRKQAACRNMPTGLFFADRAQNGYDRPAKKVCAGCPVKAACLELGLTQRYGVYGGMNERERERLKKARRTNRATA